MFWLAACAACGFD